MLTEIFHVAHVVLAGVWLGGLVFTTAVVSPAFEAMKWSEAERVAVRSAVGRQYARVGSANLVLLALFAVLNGAFEGFGARFYAEYALLVLVFGLAGAHGAYFGRRLAELARAEREADGEDARTFAGRRRSLQRVSLRVSYLNLLVSAVILVLAIGARAG
jgi:uncharacterized membrane protein